MRERTIKVNKDKLLTLSSLYRPSKIAGKLGISKQRWRHYETGKNDMPESVLDDLCEEFNLDKSDLVLAP